MATQSMPIVSYFPDDGLRPDAVGAQRHPDAVHLDDIGVISDGQHDAAHAVLRPGFLHARDDAVEPGIGFRDIDAGRLVGLLARVHRPIVRHRISLFNPGMPDRE